MELAGKTALVTGAAQRVGRDIVLTLARAGADIALHYRRSEDQARRMAGDVRAAGRRAELFQADLAKPPEIAEMFQAVARTFGRLDVLVNNAGVYERTPLAALTAEQWDAQMAVNARAPALCIRHAIDLMTRGGAIVNVTDVSARNPWGAFPAYCASKAALTAVTQSAAKALAGRNIRVNAVAPGIALWPDDISEDQKKRVLNQVPMRRAGTSQDVAAAVLFLIQNDYITAQILNVDGGWSLCTLR